MTIKEAQEQVDAWIKSVGVRYFSELTNMAILTEEVGEVARIIARRYGDQSFKPGEEAQSDLSDELVRRLLGAALPGQPDGGGPDRRFREEYREEDQSR